MKSTSDWGLWIERRARAVGFMRNADLARSIGCTQQHLSRWFSYSSPPNSMRRGLDAHLVSALKTDKHTLFSAFRDVIPEHAPFVESPAIEPMQREVIERVMSLPADRLRIVGDLARGLQSLAIAS